MIKIILDNNKLRCTRAEYASISKYQFTSRENSVPSRSRALHNGSTKEFMSPRAGVIRKKNKSRKSLRRGGSKIATRLEPRGFLTGFTDCEKAPRACNKLPKLTRQARYRTLEELFSKMYSWRRIFLFHHYTRVCPSRLSKIYVVSISRLLFLLRQAVPTFVQVK